MMSRVKLLTVRAAAQTFKRLNGATGQLRPTGGSRIIVEYQATTFNQHRMPTLLIVRRGEKGVSRGGWPLQRLPGKTTCLEWQEQPLALLAPNLCSRALRQFGLWLFTEELVDGVVLQLWAVALIGESVYGGILWRRCMANLHTEAVLCDSSNSKWRKEVARISSTRRKASIWAGSTSGGHFVRFSIDSTWGELPNWRPLFSSAHWLFLVQVPAAPLRHSSLATYHTTLDTVGPRSTWIDS